MFTEMPLLTGTDWAHVKFSEMHNQRGQSEKEEEEHGYKYVY